MLWPYYFVATYIGQELDKNQIFCVINLKNISYTNYLAIAHSNQQIIIKKRARRTHHHTRSAPIPANSNTNVHGHYYNLESSNESFLFSPLLKVSRWVKFFISIIIGRFSFGSAHHMQLRYSTIPCIHTYPFDKHHTHDIHILHRLPLLYRATKSLVYQPATVLQ